MNGYKSIHGVASAATDAVTGLLESMMGSHSRTPVLGALTLADILVFVGFLLLVVLVNGVAAAWLRRRILAAEASTEPTGWKAQTIHAMGRPLYLLIWIYGLYFAATPLLLKLPETEDGSPHGGQLLADKVFDLAVFAALVWAFFRFTKVIEAKLGGWASRTEGKLDDLLAPIVGRSLRVVVPVLGMIFALPALDLPNDYSDMVARGSSILIILTIAWILIQAVSLGERAVLLKHDIKAADNLEARKIYTQVHVLAKAAYVLIAIFTAASVLMLFEQVRQFGTSLLASAGVIGIVVGFAAQRTIANLFAGLQVALTQPIRLDDVVIVEGEWGRIEEITLTYVVVKIWDDRRLVVPLSYFIEKPFQNWTRNSANILGSIFVWADYSINVDELRPVVEQIVKDCTDWDKRFWNLQVTDTNERAMQLRVLATAADASKAWNLRCEIREKLLSFIQTRQREHLPKVRALMEGMPQVAVSKSGE